MNISATCRDCGQTETESIWPQDWNKYKEGELVQNVWPYFSADQREVLIGARTGWYFCPPCFDRIHAE